jgi:hypothetical protein
VPMLLMERVLAKSWMCENLIWLSCRFVTQEPCNRYRGKDLHTCDSTSQKRATTSSADKHYILVPNDTREVPFQLQGWCRQTPACLALCELEIPSFRGACCNRHLMHGGSPPSASSASRQKESKKIVVDEPAGCPRRAKAEGPPLPAHQILGGACWRKHPIQFFSIDTATLCLGLYYSRRGIS